MNTVKKSKPISKKPEYVSLLEAAYGAPSQNGFGSAVFFELIGENEDLEKASLEKYKYFVGEIWERFGVESWMSAWREGYTRPEKSKHNIVAELQAISDPEFKITQAVPMVLEVVQNADAAQLALSETYDAKDVVDLRVYSTGDGSAMSGLLIAGRRSNDGTTFLVFLMD